MTGPFDQLKEKELCYWLVFCRHDRFEKALFSTSCKEAGSIAQYARLRSTEENKIGSFKLELIERTIIENNNLCHLDILTSLDCTASCIWMWHGGWLNSCLPVSPSHRKQQEFDGCISTCDKSGEIFRPFWDRLHTFQYLTQPLLQQQQQGLDK